jgi:hypothetical protein
MRTVQSESVDYPSLLDTNSSESTIYERSDIVPVEREGQTYYRYTEHQYSVSEWLQQRVPQIKDQLGAMAPLIIKADKTEIAADGVDVATITVDVAEGEDYCSIYVNGPPAERAVAEGGQVVREFAAGTAGMYKVEFFSGGRQAAIIIEAV